MCIIWYRDTEEYPLDTHIVHTNTYTHIFMWIFISKMLNKHSSKVAGENYLRKKEINKIFLFSKNNIYLFVCLFWFYGSKIFITISEIFQNNLIESTDTKIWIPSKRKWPLISTFTVCLRRENRASSI